MTDYAQTYGALRSRVSDLVRGADEEHLERHTPAAPEWRVRDVVAHLSGITADINAGNLDGVATDAWTARQVDARREVREAAGDGCRNNSPARGGGSNRADDVRAHHVLDQVAAGSSVERPVDVGVTLVAR